VKFYCHIFIIMMIDSQYLTYMIFASKLTRGRLCPSLSFDPIATGEPSCPASGRATYARARNGRAARFAAFHEPQNVGRDLRGTGIREIEAAPETS
jgi:hypothetical protein